MGKDYREEIDKACRNMNEILNKQNQTAQEVDAAHHYAEIIYYLTTTAAMNKAEEEGMFSEGQSMRRTPMYDYSMEGQSMARGGRGGRGGRGRSNEGSYEGQSMRGSYEEMRGRSEEGGSYERGRGGQSGYMPREMYDWENDEYPSRR